VPSDAQYVPKHRGAAAEPALKKGIKKSVLFSGVAVAATGIAVSSGIVLKHSTPADSAAAALASARADRQHADQSQQQPSQPRSAVDLAGRSHQASRSDRRSAVDLTKKSALSQASGGQATQTENLTPTDPRDIAKSLLPQYGFSESEFGCLDALYMSESGWDVHADNPASSAYGIPQALPGSKMATAGPDWENNPTTQIKWGLQYIKGSYGTPCSAWAFKQSHNWY
jgi:hypothetical protein